jgi:hypothetical protein
MANRNLKEVFGMNYGEVKLCGSFRPNGASAVDNTLNTGHGFTVARTGVGAYTITLADSWQSLISAKFQVQMNAATDLVVQVIGAVDVLTAKTIPISALAAAVATEIASNANNRIYFELTLKNSTVSF